MRRPLLIALLLALPRAAYADDGSVDGGEDTSVTDAHPPSYPVCSEDDQSSIAPDGVQTSCSPYACGSAGTCLSVCATDRDCLSPYKCVAGNRCEDPNAPHVASPGQSEGSCAYGRASHRTFAIFALAGLACLIKRRGK